MPLVALMLGIMPSGGSEHRKVAAVRGLPEGASVSHSGDGSKSLPTEAVHSPYGEWFLSHTESFWNEK